MVEKSGAWFSYDSVRIGQGRERTPRTSCAGNSRDGRSPRTRHPRADRSGGRGDDGRGAGPTTTSDPPSGLCRTGTGGPVRTRCIRHCRDAVE
ncbi:hypothetical protein AB5I41_13525 [Sphingomonas sp. MMS24-JH45]